MTVARLYRLLLLAMLAALAGLAGPARAAVVQLDRADVTATVAGTQQPATSTRLPYHWDKLHGTASGQARFRLTVPVQDTSVPLGLYIPSALLIGWFMVRHGRHPLAATAAVALGVPAFFYLVFERWFVVPLPKGPLAMLGL